MSTLWRLEEKVATRQWSPLMQRNELIRMEHDSVVVINIRDDI